YGVRIAVCGRRSGPRGRYAVHREFRRLDRWRVCELDWAPGVLRRAWRVRAFGSAARTRAHEHAARLFGAAIGRYRMDGPGRGDRGERRCAAAHELAAHDLRSNHGPR